MATWNTHIKRRDNAVAEVMHPARAAAATKEAARTHPTDVAFPPAGPCSGPQRKATW